MRDPTIVDPLAEAQTEIVREYLGNRTYVEAVRAAHDWMREEREKICRSIEAMDRRLCKKLKVLGMDVTPSKLPRKRGRPPRDTARDLQIAAAVASIIVAGGFKPTRSHTKGRRAPSACSIVQAALARLGDYRSERSVEDIWDRYRATLLRGGC